MKKLTALALVFIMVISLIPSTGAAESLALAGKVSVYVGDTTKWTANRWVWWTSGNTGVATIDQQGNIKAHRAGVTNITATAANGEKKTVMLKVYNRAVATKPLVLAGKVSAYVGDTIKWTANRWVWWTSGNPGVATVDQNGNIKALRAGKSNITATAADGAKKTVMLTVYNRAPISLYGTTTIKTIESAQWAASEKVWWTSGNTGVATIDQQGIITPKRAGKTNITASSADGRKKTVLLTVTEDVNDTKPTVLPTGGDITLDGIKNGKHVLKHENVVVMREYKGTGGYGYKGSYIDINALATIMEGTKAAFSVTLSNGIYELKTGGKFTGKYENTNIIKKTNTSYVPLKINGKIMVLKACRCDGKDYFRIEDLALALNFKVHANYITYGFTLYPDYSYEDTDTYALTEVFGIGDTMQYGTYNYESVSAVQQFKYLNEGLAYAYEEDDSLNIVTPSKRYRVKMEYPILGDVIADNAGNFYVVWGRSNKTENAAVETIFISKYSKDAKLIKTTGFVGVSTPWGNDDSAKTRRPFDAGNSVSVINGNKLLNYHSKIRYDGHQSDCLIGVDIRDMSPLPLNKTTFTGHSFAQRVIYSTIAKDFVFASQGDAYSRGFRVNKSDGVYGDENETIFHFYLESNANYNMSIVNKTFAQLGALLETSAGVVLVGASAKSISEAAKTEKQNLFVQIFNPNAGKISKSMFVGGVERHGAMSFDINDNDNSPLTPVTDYGVQWLTNYTDCNVIRPHAVVVNDKIVILWNVESGEGFYMVLAKNGTVIKGATSLGKDCMFNPGEAPIYHNGRVYWAGAKYGKISVKSFAVS